MYGYRRGGFEDALAGEGAALVIILVILAVAMTVAVIVATLKEIGRVVKASATYSDHTKRIVWIALVGFACIVLICGVVTALALTAAPAAVYTVAWSFLLMVIVIEVCDWRERKQENASGDLDAYIDFGDYASIPTGSNGHASNGHRETEAVAAK